MCIHIDICIHIGFGLKLCGGVRCTNCNSFHAIVTGMSASLYEADDIQEGEPRFHSCNLPRVFIPLSNN